MTCSVERGGTASTIRAGTVARARASRRACVRHVSSGASATGREGWSMGSPRRAARRPAAYLAAAALAFLAVGCSEPAHVPRPTDPHQIVTEAVKATAALLSVRIHVELVSTITGDIPGIANRVPMRSSMGLDAVIDLAPGPLAGRPASTMPGGGGGTFG